MPRNGLVILSMLLLAGCATMSAEERRAADEARCRAYGFTQRNDAFAACMQRLDLDRRAEWRAQQERLDASWDRPMVVYRPVYVPAPQPR